DPLHVPLDSVFIGSVGSNQDARHQDQAVRVHCPIPPIVDLLDANSLGTRARLTVSSATLPTVRARLQTVLRWTLHHYAALKVYLQSARIELMWPSGGTAVGSPMAVPAGSPLASLRHQPLTGHQVCHASPRTTRKQAPPPPEQ